MIRKALNSSVNKGKKKSALFLVCSADMCQWARRETLASFRVPPLRPRTQPRGADVSAEHARAQSHNVQKKNLLRLNKVESNVWHLVNHACSAAPVAPPLRTQPRLLAIFCPRLFLRSFPR